MKSHVLKKAIQVFGKVWAVGAAINVNYNPFILITSFSMVIYQLPCRKLLPCIGYILDINHYYDIYLVITHIGGENVLVTILPEHCSTDIW